MMQTALFNFINGLRSGIPLCCTVFFIKECRIPGPVGARIYEKRSGKKFDVFGDNEDDNAQYVRCDTCYSRQKVKEIRENGVIMKWLIRSKCD